MYIDSSGARKSKYNKKVLKYKVDVESESEDYEHDEEKVKKGPTLERLGKPKPEAEDESDGKDEGEKQRLEEVTAFKQELQTFKKFGDAMLSKTARLSDLISSIESYRTYVEKDSSDERKIDKHEYEKVEVVRAEAAGMSGEEHEKRLLAKIAKQTQASTVEGLQLLKFRWMEDPALNTRAGTLDQGASPGPLQPHRGGGPRIRVEDAEEACHKFFRKYGLTLPVEIESIRAGPQELSRLPIVKISSYVKYLLDYDKLECLVGVGEDEMEPLLTEFWARYKKLHPDNQLFVLADNGEVCLSRTIPLFAHVDEGRTYKSKALLVLSVHGCLGKGTRAYNKRQVRKLHLKEDPMPLNYVGSTWSTHFTFASLLRASMNKHPESLDALMGSFSADLHFCSTTGIAASSGQRKVWVQVIGLKGDLPALSKVGGFERSFARVPKKAASKINCPGICWMCMAGVEEPEHVPFEDFTPQAAWKNTMFQKRPWVNDPPIIQGVALEPSQPEAWFLTDLWHNFHNGLAKFWVANALVMFMFTPGLVPARSVESRLQWLSNDFLAFCNRKKILPFLREFNRDNLSLDSFHSYPQGLWSKAVVSTQTMLYVEDFCERFIRGKTDDQILKDIAP
ncbi:unnamed protein product [Symbiodinium microadriaticum]|nr:unnamed protein product [Symbiodinium microadriaticum]